MHEQRSSVRRATRRKVIVYPEQQQPCYGVIQDFSTGGLFIETTAEPPPLDSSVVLSFQVSGAKQRRALRLRAVVVHREQGIGMMFPDYDEATVESLRQLYHSALSLSAAPT